MAQSPEYPDLRWIEPYAWGKGRDGKAVRYIVIHYTAGSETATSAENGAIYNQNRRDGTSAHYFVDRDSVVQGVRTRDRANCARHRGNRLGIQYELCGTAQTRKQWLDTASLATLKLAAKQVARDCKKHAIPVRRLSIAETRRAWTEYPNGPRGIVGHVDCTYAYPEDEGDHTDPGAHFPWDIFLDFVRAELEEDDMPNPAEYAQAVVSKFHEDLINPKSGLRKSLPSAVWAYEVTLPAVEGRPAKKVSVATIMQWLDAGELGTRDVVTEARDRVLADLAALGEKVDALSTPEVR